MWQRGWRWLAAASVCLSFLVAACTAAPRAGQAGAAGAPARLMENLGRGVVAVHHQEGKVFISWRLLGTDPENLAFNVYRKTGEAQAVCLNNQPLTGPTHYVDAGADFTQPNAYFVRPVLEGDEQDPSAAFTLATGAPVQPYFSIPLQTPEGYSPGDCSVGDLDGDGEYEIIVHMSGRGRDNSQAGETTSPIFHAYKLDGTLLWSINLGINIREGAHYTQFMVYDLDGDGRAEMVCKTADGTTDGLGDVIGDAKADHRNKSGYILQGPEYLTVFDGLTGKALATANYLPSRHPSTPNPTDAQLKQIWGDGYGNRCDRFLACVAYLDGVHPSVVMCRGYYTRTVLAAWDFKHGKLVSRWVFDGNEPENKGYNGQGNHNLTVADVDGDGKDEIVYGSMCVDDNGKGLYTTGLGHGDAMHVSDMDPARPGLEVWACHESKGNGVTYRDAKTGQVLNQFKLKKDVGRACAADVDPRFPGYEMWGAGKMYSAQGQEILPPDTSPNLPHNFLIWWDGDDLRELLDGITVSKWNPELSKAEMIFDAQAYDCVPINHTKKNPNLSADILGDWREEIITRSKDGKELRIFTTTIPTPRRMHTLMHDPQYRLSIAWQNVAYNQPPHVGFFLGHGMPEPPKPNIELVQAREKR